MEGKSQIVIINNTVAATVYEDLYKQMNILRLYEQMKTYILICATSVPPESIFSIAGYIQRKERCLLSSKMLKFLF